MRISPNKKSTILMGMLFFYLILCRAAFATTGFKSQIVININQSGLYGPKIGLYILHDYSICGRL